MIRKILMENEILMSVLNETIISMLQQKTEVKMKSGSYI
jgi:hypothetical protein